jgi:small subunit ribosomal protein S18
MVMNEENIEERTITQDDRTDTGRGTPGGDDVPRPRRRGFFGRRRRPCFFCVDKVRKIDYKNVDGLRRFLSDRGRIEARRRVGTCAKHQRALATALKRARHLALLPYTVEHIRGSGFSPSHR